MDEDYFQDGEYQQTPHQQNHQTQVMMNYHQPQNTHNQQDNQWDYGQIQPNNTANLNTNHTINSHSQSNSNRNVEINFSSSQNIQVDDQLTKKIREQQERIQNILRQKANKQYQQKLARKQSGRQQIQQFFQKKQKQKQQRKQKNLKHQKLIIAKAKQLNQTPGWTKVAENVNLKLGQYKGNKPVNRMRQALINKRQDQKSQQ